MSDLQKSNLAYAILFANKLRESLENIRAQTEDGNVKEYLDYLLEDDRDAKAE